MPRLKPGFGVDVGCGFGLESLRFARLAQPGGRVVGIGNSADFIREAEARAAQAKLAVAFEVADAPHPAVRGRHFDIARAERLLVYLPDPKRALEEMRQVTRTGGIVTAIEPDFGTNAHQLGRPRSRAPRARP